MEKKPKFIEDVEAQLKADWDKRWDKMSVKEQMDFIKCEEIQRDAIERLKRIIKIAYALKWIRPPEKSSYPLMQLSEVEKCMLAMMDDNDMKRMEQWYLETTGKKVD